jgi:hypothetical protein
MRFTIAAILSLAATQVAALPVAQLPSFSWKGPSGAGCTIGFLNGACTDLLGNTAHLGLDGFGINLSMSYLEGDEQIDG